MLIIENYNKKMFAKYVSKLTNTIGTINYLQKKSRRNGEQQWYIKNSSKPVFDDSTVRDNNIDTVLTSKRSQVLIHNFATESRIILSASIAKLRYTLFANELV